MSSSMQNNLPVGQIIRSTREASWAEDFVDLSEFCHQPIRIKTEHLVDEQISPISSTAVQDQQRGFDYNNLEGRLGEIGSSNNSGGGEYFKNDINCSGDICGSTNSWYNGEGKNLLCPVAVQEELCDPITDWFNNATASVTPTNSNLPLSSTTNSGHPSCVQSVVETNNDLLLSQALLSMSSTTTSADNIAGGRPQYKVEPGDDPFLGSVASATSTCSPPLLPDSSLSVVPTPTTEPAGQFATLGQAHMQQKMPPLLRLKPTSGGNPDYGNVVSSSITNVQSPSITQSDLNNQEDGIFKLPMGNLTKRRNATAKLDLQLSGGGQNNNAAAYTPCSMNTPEVLEPLVDKDLEFDLVSYVFDNSKSSSGSSLDITESYNTSGDRNSIANTEKDGVGFEDRVSIKTEPLEDAYDKFSGSRETETSIGKRSFDDRSAGKNKRRRSSFSDEQFDMETESAEKKFKGDKDLTQYESEKYRELRDRNNEASRRSRANRKTREMELQNQADTLEAENQSLKLRAEEMEGLVKRLRECLMKLVLKKR